MHVSCPSHAHPEPTSSTAALKDATARTVKDAGQTVEVTDLDEERFASDGVYGYI